MFEVPNLDDMSVDPKDYTEAALVLAQLAAYASHKAASMEGRLSGDLQTAMAAERSMEAIYRKLPKWARW